MAQASRVMLQLYLAPAFHGRHYFISLLPFLGFTHPLTGKLNDIFYVSLLDLSVVIATVPAEKLETLGFHGTIYCPSFIF